MILTGLRGVGKTVLLNEIERLARNDGYHTVAFEAHEDKSLAILIVPYLRSLIFELNRLAGTGEKVKRSLAVLRSFIGGIKVSVGEVSFGLDIEPEQGTADSGDIEIDLPSLFVAVGVAALNYEGILTKLRQNRYNNLTKRAHLKTLERIALIPRAVYSAYGGVL